jgi:hypothetical protein
MSSAGLTQSLGSTTTVRLEQTTAATVHNSNRSLYDQRKETTRVSAFSGFTLGKVLALAKCLLKNPIQFQTLNFVLVESKLQLIV